MSDASYDAVRFSREHDGTWNVTDAPQRAGFSLELLERGAARFLDWDDQRIRITADNGTWVYAWVGTDCDGRVLIGERRD